MWPLQPTAPQTLHPRPNKATQHPSGPPESVMHPTSNPRALAFQNQCTNFQYSCTTQRFRCAMLYREMALCLTWTFADQKRCPKRQRVCSAMTFDISGATGALAAIASTASFAPQAWKIIKTRETKNLSTIMYGLTVL